MRLVPLALAAVLAFAAKKPVTIKLAAQAAKEAGPSGIVWSGDGARFVWQEDRKLWVYEVASKSKREVVGYAALEQTAVDVRSPEQFGWVNRGVKEKPIQWFPDGARLLVAIKGDLFSLGLDGKGEQLTKTDQTEADPKLSPDGRWVSFRRNHELHVLDLRSRKATRLTHDATATRWNAELDWVYPEELAIPTAHWWSPDSRRIAYMQFDVGALMVYPHADLLNLRPLAEPQRYPQAGTNNPTVRVGLVPAGGGKTKWLDLPGPADQLMARVTWLPDSSNVAVHLLPRVQNKLDVVAGGKTLVAETAEAWINLRDDFAFLRDSARMVWGSDRGSGYRHLFVHGIGGGETRQITRGEWEVTDVACVDEKGARVFYVSTEPDARERQLWVVGLDGSGKRRITAEAGTHSISMAPGCGSYVDTWSTLTEPVRKALHYADGRLADVLREANRTVADDYELLPNQLVDFKGADGTLYHARLIKPAGFDASRKYPVVVMVYGGPHAQTVKNQWRGADWDQVLAHRGFVVWQMDGRGSAGRGHLFEKPLHRRFGRQELADQVEGVGHLVSLGFVDPARVGVYGWSYGGYMTLNAMFNAGDVFAAGVAGAPVTDWRQYDTIYTERYMGLPQENEQGYKESSVVHQAGRLKGRLMLAHNFEDDNVLFQHTLRMMDELQRAGKQFDLLLYPQKAHAVGGAVRKQMLESMTAFFERNLAGR